MSKIPKTRTQAITDFFGWVLFFCIYFGLICLFTAWLFWSMDVPKIWNSWTLSWKIMAGIFYGGCFGLYSYLMWNIALVFQVLSAVLQARLIRTKIWAEKKRNEILLEYTEALKGNTHIEKSIKKEKKEKKKKKEKKVKKERKFGLFKKGDKKKEDVVPVTKVIDAKGLPDAPPLPEATITPYVLDEDGDLKKIDTDV